MRTSLIVALDHHGVIGKANQLPWHLPSDLKKFREVTWGKPIIMGRKTHESIGKPLPGRQNIVLTRQSGFSAPGVDIVHSFDEALHVAHPCEEAMIIGGSSLFAEFLPHADRLYLTVIHATFDGDTFFPIFDFAQWSIAQKQHTMKDEKNAWEHTLFVLERRNDSPAAVELTDKPWDIPDALKHP